jgi:type I restriction enzyme R subunit
VPSRSAAEDSPGAEILDYFLTTPVQVGTGSHAKRPRIQHHTYFSDPFTRATRWKQGIEDGFLAPYKVIRIG